MGKKVVYRIFTIADYDREASYFKKMHGQGWKLKKVNYSPFIINYSKIVVGSILQILINFPISASRLLSLMRKVTLRSIMMLGLS